MKEFLEGDSYSLVGSCLTEVPVSLLMEETDGYAMRQRDEKRVKRRHNLFAENSKHLSWESPKTWSCEWNDRESQHGY